MIGNRKVVCICGSTDPRFTDRTRQVISRETRAGHVVLSHSGMRAPPEYRDALDVLHLEKIAFADEVLLLNFDGYVGDGLRREWRYAESLKKPLRWEEPELAPYEIKKGG